MSNYILSYEVGLAIDIIHEKGGNCSFYLQSPIKSRFSKKFTIKKRVVFDTTFLFRKENKLYFSEWHEDPEYREEVNVREYPTGKILERIQGTEMTMPDGQVWVLR